MDFQVIAAIVFIVVLTIYLIVIRKRLDIQKILFPFLYIILYRSQFGLKFMKRFAQKFPRFTKVMASIGVVIGFLGMAFISIQLIIVFKNMIVEPEAPSGVAPVLPVPVQGAVYVPFFYWIISIFIIALVHEFAHGIVSNLYKIPVRTSGFAFFGLVLPIIPAAFVEPDEKILPKKSAWKQLSVFAAGPFSNIILAFLVLGLMLVTVNPLSGMAYEATGVVVTDVYNETAAAQAGLSGNELITAVDGVPVYTVNQFTQELDAKSPGEPITVTTNASNYNIALESREDDPDDAFLGVSVVQGSAVNKEFEAKYGSFAVGAIDWFAELFFWLYVLNLGIGLFNLVPLGIVDGGRMLQVAVGAIFRTRKGQKHAEMIWKIVSITFLVIILFMLIRSFM
ncbi:MAG: site-2 protease family protein [Nanoarchaeota archaeon]